ncbi:MAG: tetratricopeptide repeat protein [Saprospiraceae bacterium]|uniref:Tetratricopeptide repeat protein n=1 Tax=Candidatus Defluviibacterium haderslevense TaxID=2981993 RepID=A0A9D7S7C1_9BACT|nr:tetratricopeptide repeat protein [Candidatus Defluviibacterium haderslevense]
MKYLCLSCLLWMPYLLSSQSIDSSAIKEIDSLIKVSRKLIGKNEFDKALEVNMIAEKLALEKLGLESVEYGNACFNHGRILHFKSDFLGAEGYYLESKEIRKKILGTQNLDYALNLNNLANLYKEIGQYDKAEMFFLESIQIKKKILGIEHSDYASSLNNIGLLYFAKGNLEKAGEYALEAKAIFKKANGQNDINFLGATINLANVYYIMYNYEKAEFLYLEVIKIFEERLKNFNHPFYSNCLNNLANLYKDEYKFEKAEKLYLKSADLVINNFGANHEDYAIRLSNMASLYLNMGNYKKAESLYLSSKDIYEAKYGKVHPDYISILHNLATLYKKLANFEKAELLFLESKALREQALGKEHVDYSSSLNGLANLYADLGDFEKAEQLYLESKTIRENVLGKEHPEYATSLDNLAILYKMEGKFEEAEQLYLESKTIRENVLGKEHPEYASSLNNLAILYEESSNYKEAERFYLESKVIREKILGKEHLDYISIIKNLACFYEVQKRFIESNQLLMEFYSLEQVVLTKGTTFLSERELTNYISIFKQNGDDLGKYLISRYSNSTPFGILASIYYNHVLFHKGFLLASSTKLNINASQYPLEYEINCKLKSCRRQIANEYSKPKINGVTLTELEESSNALEKELINSLASYGEAIRQIKWREVRNKLELKDVAIEFIHFKFNDKNQTDSFLYAALVLLPNDTTPHFVPLFEEKELNQLLSTSQSRRMDYVADVYHSPNDRGTMPQDVQTKSLYELIWKPIEPYLKGVNKIYFSPSGLLHRINQNAIAINDQSLLSDRYDLVQLGSTRQLVSNNDDKKSKILNACIYGGINFEMDSTAVKATHHEIDTNGIALRSELSFSYTDSTLRGGSWNYLNGSEQEANEINKIIHKAGIKSSLFKGNDATEEAFKKARRL